MTVLLLAVVAIGAGLVGIVTAPTWRRVGVAVGVIGSLAVLGIALAMPSEESVELGGVGLVGTPLVRELAVAWSAGLAALGLLEVGVGGRPTVVGPGLVGLAVAVVALATRDPASSMAALAAGGVAGILVPGISGWLDGADAPSRLATTSRGSLAILGAGLLGMAAIAVGASPAGPLGIAGANANDPTVQAVAGLALLAMVGAVAIRCSLIPLHVWAARFMEGVSPLAIPAAFAWGGAAFILVAIDWSQVALGPSATADPVRGLIIGLSFVSLVLGGLAAMVHDDIEHVLGYSILQDAGVAILAFASLEPQVAAAARNWLLASATIKTALAAWATVVRSAYGGHRLADLGGWARHSPALGISFAGILVAAVGLPGIAIWESRASLIGSAMPGIAGIVTPLVALMPAVYLGRIALAGVERISPAVAAGPTGWPRWRGDRAEARSDARRLDPLRAVPAAIRANRVPLMALGVLVLAVMAVLTAIGGTAGP
ncbi:MAG TPA: proton-conducting transporter membrane subunit [Candidatus Limnocylindrales bacterium]|nr:proton-conducting transporter membrane subunit [Candidatus Limnocylindrales bacterium]